MMSRYIAIYVAISHTPDHLETPCTNKSRFSENPPPRCGLLLLFSALSLPSSWLWSSGLFVVLLLSISWTHNKTDRITSVPSGLGLVPERMHVFFFHFSFFFFSFFPCLFSFLMPGSSTWYSIYYRCSRSWAFHVAIVILCCCREMWSPSA